MPGAPVHIDFDDLIYALQRSGGASTYWSEITSRLRADTRFRVTRRSPSRWRRGVPAWSNAAVFHSSHFRVCAGGRARMVSTVHDLNYELGLLRGGIGARLNIAERRLSYFTADALICISESTRNDLRSIYPSLERRCPVYVIHHGCSRLPDPSPTVEEAERRGIGGPFLLYVGGRNTYKNFPVALQGYLASGVWRDGVRLVCTGAPFDEQERALISSMGLGGHLLALQHVSGERLAALYRAAHCLLYTSSYEGFGLPPLEAMALGCPVVACATSSIPEVTGDAAILVPPGSVDGIARGIVGLQDGAERSRLVKLGLDRAGRFSWDESARRHAEVYLSLSSQRC